MTKSRTSIGVDTPTGEPADGPAGPYVTDAHEDDVAAAMGRTRPDRDAMPRKSRQVTPQTTDEEQARRSAHAKRVKSAKPA